MAAIMGKKGVSVKLDKQRTLRYGINAIITLEESLGCKITEFDLEKMSFKQLRDIIHAGLLHEDKELTPEVVGDLIDTYSSIEEIAEKMSYAFDLAFGPQKLKNK